MKKITKPLFIIGGLIFLVIGVIGIVLPIIPTTPLLLLASFCFIKGSKRFEVWFKGTKLYKKYVEDFLRHRSMTLKQKIFLNLFADSMIAIGFFSVDIIPVRILLIIIVLYKYYYFATQIKTVRKEDLNRQIS
jgi:uncharacterized membrane protein YbaN (DUF454 family)